jgi:hypothetical protein
MKKNFNIMSYILFLRVQVYSAGCVLAKIRAYSFIYVLHASFIGDFFSKHSFCCITIMPNN